jgi:hypothetical protein
MQKQILSRGCDYERGQTERGQTMILVAISLLSLLAMAALAIDIVTLYAARSEIQRAADAAALAGAKAVADSGFTTLPTNDPHYIDGSAQLLARNMASGAVAALVNPSSSINLVSGAPPTLVTPLPIPVDFTRQGNPQVTISLRRDSLPTFFSKIWARGLASVTATATAEVYNPANLPTMTPIVPRNVKPWLVANADPLQGGAQFVNPATGAVEASVITEPFYLHSDCSPSAFPLCSDALPGHNLNDNPPRSIGTLGHPQVDYLPAQVTPDVAGSNVCPAACAGATDYERSIECADVATSYQVLSCGGGATSAQWDHNVSPGGVGGLSDLGVECLIHASGTGNNKGQDELDKSPWPGSPMQITAGSGLQNGNLVTTSSSIVTIPIVDYCTAPNCVSPLGGPVTIVGYMQAFINQVHGTGPPPAQGDINITVLNITACSSPNAANPVVGGAGTSPVPVRLITPP